MSMQITWLLSGSHNGGKVETMMTLATIAMSVIVHWFMSSWQCSNEPCDLSGAVNLHCSSWPSRNSNTFEKSQRLRSILNSTVGARNIYSTKPLLVLSCTHGEELVTSSQSAGYNEKPRGPERRATLFRVSCPVSHPHKSATAVPKEVQTLTPATLAVFWHWPYLVSPFERICSNQFLIGL